MAQSTREHGDRIEGARGRYGHRLECGEILIGRDWYELSNWNLSLGRCGNCSAPIAGIFEAAPGYWGSRRQQIYVRH